MLAWQHSICDMWCELCILAMCACILSVNVKLCYLHLESSHARAYSLPDPEPDSTCSRKFSSSGWQESVIWPCSAQTFTWTQRWPHKNFLVKGHLEKMLNISCKRRGDLDYLVVLCPSCMYLDSLVVDSVEAYWRHTESVKGHEQTKKHGLPWLHF